MLKFSVCDTLVVPSTRLPSAVRERCNFDYVSMDAIRAHFAAGPPLQQRERVVAGGHKRHDSIAKRHDDA